MPKILINEKDNTSPGTPSSYANYSVLLVGFSKYTETENAERLKNDPTLELVEADSNGVYEFTSKSDFENTIGLVGPEQSYEISKTTVGGDGKPTTVPVNNIIYHYGNQMAYELLGMGYTVIYKPITIANIIDYPEGSTTEELITGDSFWEIFKDKASYDFRFITHGFLSAAEMPSEYFANLERAEAVDKAIAELDNILKRATEAVESADPDEQLSLEEALNTEYLLIVEDKEKIKEFSGFIDKTTGEPYPAYSDVLDEDGLLITAGALGGTRAERASLTAAIADADEGKLTPSLFNEINGQIANLAKYKAKGAEDTNDMSALEIPGRGDCIALIELDELTYSGSKIKPEASIVDGINEIAQINADNGKYCAMTVPSVVYKMSDDDRFKNNKKFPGAFHYLACFKNSLGLGFAEWYAVAGYTRGVSSYVIDTTTVKLGEIAINALEPRNIVNQQTQPKFACNVIANFRGNYYLWGNRTAHLLGEKNSGADLVASHFLNIRQLCTTIKKQLYVACRRFTFDPNSDVLWFNFVNAIRPTLESMKIGQGVRDYRILKVYTDKKATLKAKIRIIPIEAVEDFDLEISLEDSFGETTASIAE